MDGDLRIGPWLIQPGLNTISRNGLCRQLQPRVMEVLVCLAHHSGETVSKEQLLKTVWPNTFVSDDVLVRAISELRHALEDDPKESQVIQTIAKRGYRLLLSATPVNGAAPTVAAPFATIESTARATSSRRSLIGIAMGATATLLLLTVLALEPRGMWRTFIGKTNIPQIRSLAVLPLQNLSGDPSQEYFVDAMTEELITELSRLSALRVISRFGHALQED